MSEHEEFLPHSIAVDKLSIYIEKKQTNITNEKFQTNITNEKFQTNITNENNKK
jgi:hypothetical protein